MFENRNTNGDRIRKTADFGLIMQIIYRAGNQEEFKSLCQTYNEIGISYEIDEERLEVYPDYEQSADFGALLCGEEVPPKQPVN